MPRVEASDGTELFYADVGSGPPIVLVHGGFMSHRVWDYQIEILAEHYRIIAPDLSGHGDSEKPYVQYTPKRFARDVATVIDAIDVCGATLVGWSLGATVSTMYLAEYGDRIDTAVLLSSGLFEGIAQRTDEIDEGLDFDGLIDAHRSNRPDAMMAFVEGLFADEPSENVRHWLWNLGMDCPMHVGIDVLELYASMNYGDYHERMAEIRIPVAVFQGAHDAAATLSAAEFVAGEVLLHGTFVPFRDSAHLPFLEQRDRFNEKLINFVEEAG